VRAAASLTILDSGSLAIIARWRERQDPSAPLPGEVAHLVERNRLAVRVAEEARQRPATDWEVDYAHDANIPPLYDIRTLGTVLALTCQVDVTAGRGDQAVEAALAGLAVSASLRHEPLLIIQLIRIAVANDHFGCLHDLLRRAEPSESALAQLSKALPENRSPDAIGSALVGEMKRIHNGLAEFDRSGGRNPLFGDDSWWAAPVGWLCQPLWRYVHLRYLQATSHTIQAQSAPVHARASSTTHTSSKLRWWHLGRQVDAFLGRVPGHVGSERAIDTGNEYLGVLSAVELSVALRRFRLSRHLYPDMLTELTPEYLPQLPVDPFTGQPPEYAKQGAGFRLRVHGASAHPNSLLDWTIPQ
jgi:hypothetical protein